jgi:cytochrome c oxidase cbb3-type subunit 4
MEMDSTYMALAAFAQTWGLVYFVIVFLCVSAYALWPTNRQRFERAARMPLRED